MSALTSSVSIAGLRMSPASPPVQHTSTHHAPSSWYLATVPAPFDDSSSGWACTASRRSWSSVLKRCPIGREAASAAVPHGDDATDDHAHHRTDGQRDASEGVAEERAIEAVRVGLRQRVHGNGDDAVDHRHRGESDGHADGEPEQEGTARHSCSMVRLPSLVVHPLTRSAAAAVAVALLLGACGGGSDSAEDQGRSIADAAGLPKDVGDFFALATKGLNATYRVTLDTVDTAGKPVQVTTTQRPPDVRFDAFHADGSVDSTIGTGGKRFQCTMTNNAWQCGELGATDPIGEVFDPKTVTDAVTKLQQQTDVFDFRVESRTIAGVNARCLVTTPKPTAVSGSSSPGSATMCLSPEGAILLVEVPTGTITASSYSTTIPDDAFRLPADPSTTTTATATTTSSPAN